MSTQRTVEEAYRRGFKSSRRNNGCCCRSWDCETCVFRAGSGWASAILIEHGSGNFNFVTQYMHAEPNAGISPGVQVKRGQAIASVARISTPHLHFGVWNGPYGSSAAQRGALPSCAPRATSCNDGTYNDPCFPQLWVNPMSFF